MEKLLVTGIDGLLGSNLALAMSERFEVVGVCSSPGIELDECRVVTCPSDHPAALATIVRQAAPQWIIHCGPASLSSWSVPADDLSCVGAVECSVVQSLWKAAADAGSRLTVISSDRVCSGPRIFQDEACPADGNAPAAAAIRAVERALEVTGALVVRTHAYGWSPACDSFAERAWMSVVEGAPCAAEGGCYATPILATDLADLLFRAYQTRLSGLYHIAGAERTSSLRFIAELAAACGLKDRSARERVAPSAGEHRDRRETTLNCRRARRALDLPMPLLREGLGRFVAQAENGFRARIARAACVPSAEQYAA